MILTQSNFFIMHMCSSPNMNSLIENIRNGRFDLILVKPIPSPFYSSIREIILMNFLRDGIPSSIAIAMSINCREINTSLLQILCTIIIFISGQIAFHFFQLLLAIPVFLFWRVNESYRTDL